MAGNAATFSLSPWPAKAQPPEPLRSQIGRIHKQRGHFRSMNETTLEGEVRALEQGVSEAQTDNENTNSAQDIDTARKEFYAKREELRKFIGQAENEALMGLDFISLLISKDAPHKGQQSMSPALKNMTNAGTLTFDKTQSASKSKELDFKDEQTISGWTLQSLSDTADSLLDAASKLQNEMQREARYWSDVLSMKEKGFSVYRAQKNSATLAVRYGFTESAPQFQAQGIAPLRQDPDGAIKLARSLSKQPKTLRVSILDGTRVVQTSSARNTSVNESESAGSLVQRASDSIFEEDLFHELSRETRSLLSYGVKLVDQTIQVPLRLPSSSWEEGVSKTFTIELRPRSEEVTELEETENTVASGLALLLRLGLTSVYRQKLHNRSLPPPPISDEIRPSPVHSILSSVLSMFQHLENVKYLQNHFTALRDNLEAIGYSANHSSKSQRPDLSRVVNGSGISNVNSVEQISKELTPPFTSSIYFEALQGVSITLNITTEFSFPSFGTTFQLFSRDFDGTALTTSFTDRAEVLEDIFDSIQSSLGRSISGMNLGWKQQEGGSLYKESLIGSQSSSPALVVRVHDGNIIFGIGRSLDKGKDRRIYRVEPKTKKPLKEIIEFLEKPYNN